MRRIGICLACVLAGLSGVQACPQAEKAAKAPVILEAGVNAENPARIHVLLEDPTPKAADLPGRDGWLVYEKTQTGKTAPARMHKLEVESVDTSELGTSDMLYLNLKEPVSDDVTWMELTMSGESYLLHQQVSFHPKKGGEKPPPLAGAPNKSDSDVYFNGSLAATAGQSPVYNIDAFAGYMEGLQSKKRYFGELGAYGQVRTIQSNAINPNSFEVYGVYQRMVTKTEHWYGPFQAPYVTYRFAGWEFDLGGKELNFVTSPVVTIPFRFSGKQGVMKKGFTAPHMVLHLGTEFVDVEQSALARTGAWHTRGLMGVSFATAYQPADATKYLDSVTLSSAYQVRLVSAPEIFYDPKFATINRATGVAVTPPMLGTQPRHFVDTTLCYHLTKWVGVTFENTYGSLPPAFNKTPVTYNLGLSFTLKEPSAARYSILRP
jgi:hypothetical protein